MIPILFPSGATDFSTNGLGRLADALECTVTEERNGPYELFLKYPISGAHFAEIALSAIIYADPAPGKGPQPFRVYRIERPIDGVCSIYAEHISYQLSMIPVMPFTAGSCAGALQQMVGNSAQDNPFTVWTDKNVNGAFNLTAPRAFRDLLGGSSGSILDVYGTGEYEFDAYTVKLHLHRGADRGVVIRYGKNLADLTQNSNISDTITGICPYWLGSDGGLVTLPEKSVWCERVENYPFRRAAVIDFSVEFENAPSVEQLRARANRYMAANDIGAPKINLDVEFIPLAGASGFSATAPGAEISENASRALERIYLCDTVTISYPALGVDATAKIIKAEFNVLENRYNSLEIGDARTRLQSEIATAMRPEMAAELENYSTKSDLAQSVDRATQLITGGLGGYVVTRLNADGQPEELMVLGDSPDYTQAAQVWRWNKNGLGYSGTGYGGPYNTAITKDGHIVADFIDTGTLTANVIRAGLLTDTRGRNYWDLDSGEISIQGYATTDDAQSKADAALDAAKGYTDELSTALNQAEVLRRLTGGYTSAGLYIQNGHLYINGSYVKTGTLAADRVLLYGDMNVYTDSTGQTRGGYIGYGSGLSDQGGTSGIHIVDATSNNEVIATNSGVRMTSHNGSAWVEPSYDVNLIAGRSVNANMDITVTSDRRQKEGISYDMGKYGAVLEHLKPVHFRYKSAPALERVGLIAQDVKETLDAAGLTDCAIVQEREDGTLSLAYQELIPLLIGKIQELGKRVEELEGRT